MKIPDFFTIGVYGKTEEEFFQSLVDNGIDAFIDIRQRRAVRGSKYAFVNSKRLQARLAILNIGYLHIIELAPTKQIRQLQKEADTHAGVKKTDRSALSSVFVENYKSEILNKFGLTEFVQRLTDNHLKRVVLFCVEREPTACHRSLVAEKISAQLNVGVKNL